jgi:protocatechuate 3,4-dioxygenase beta subunit
MAETHVSESPVEIEVIAGRIDGAARWRDAFMRFSSNSHGPVPKVCPSTASQHGKRVILMSQPLVLDPAYDDLEDHDRGLVFDLVTLDRRRMLKLLGFGGVSVSLFTIAGCGPTGATGSEAATAAASASEAGGASCAIIPEETAGPYPGDGSNGPNILAESGVVRSDIRSSFGSSTTVAAGIPLAIQLTIQDGADCVPLAGAAVYLWHCDRDGNYSLYSDAVTGENYLRGVQAADDAGMVTFTSIFPACYPGRWPHIHFEVYPSLELATNEANKIATSQIALPEDACAAVYATDGYAQSVTTLSQVSLASDNVFGEDGGVRQLGTVSGDASAGYSVALTVPVNA